MDGAAGKGLIRCYAFAGGIWFVGLAWQLVLLYAIEDVADEWKTLPAKGDPDDRGRPPCPVVCETSPGVQGCDEGWTPVIEGDSAKCFRRSSELAYRDEALQICHGAGYRAAVIHSAAENLAAGRVCGGDEWMSRFRWTDGCWIGLFYANKTWVDGSRLDFTKWASGHPTHHDHTILGFRAIFPYPGIWAALGGLFAAILGMAACFYCGTTQRDADTIACAVRCSKGCGGGVVVTMIFLIVVVIIGTSSMVLWELIWMLPSLAALSCIYLKSRQLEQELRSTQVVACEPVRVEQMNQ